MEHLHVRHLVVTMMWARFLLGNSSAQWACCMHSIDGYMKEEKNNGKRSQFLLAGEKTHSELGVFWLNEKEKLEIFPISMQS